MPLGEKFLRFDFRITEFYKLSRWNNLRFEEDETLLVSVVEKKNFFLLSLPGGKRELGMWAPINTLLVIRFCRRDLL